MAYDEEAAEKRRLAWLEEDKEAAALRRQTLAWLEEEKRTRHDQRVIPWGAVVSPLSTYVAFLKADYEQTQNPIYVYEARTALRGAGFNPYDFEWIAAYQDKVDKNVMGLVETLPDERGISDSIRIAFGFGQKPFSKAKKRLRNRRIANEVLHRISHGEDATIAIREVAKKAKVLTRTAGNAWRALKTQN